MIIKNKFFVIIQLILLFLGNNLIAQNQEKLELKWARKSFRKNKHAQSYPRFLGQITSIDHNTYKFDEKTLTVHNACIETIYLLANGIFYPNIITGNSIAEIKTKQELDTLSESQRLFYNISRTDSLIISDFEKLKSLSKSLSQKRFKFYLYQLGMMNPQICFIELTNLKATKGWTLLDFIKDCKVTYFEKGSILL